MILFCTLNVSNYEPPIGFGTGASYVQTLSWNIRMKVALDAAKGLAFLHSDEAKVIYRDFKTANILLDSVRESH